MVFHEQNRIKPAHGQPRCGGLGFVFLRPLGAHRRPLLGAEIIRRSVKSGVQKLDLCTVYMITFDMCICKL